MWTSLPSQIMLVFLQGWVGTEEPAEPEASGGTSSVAKRDVRFWLLKLTKLLFFGVTLVMPFGTCRTTLRRRKEKGKFIAAQSLTPILLIAFFLLAQS